MDGLPRSLVSDVAMCQQTLKAPIGCVGVGLHSGCRVNLTFRPAPVDHGIVFRRPDLGVDIPARFDRVVETHLSTVLAEGDARIGTVEHVMAALAGSGIDNVLVEVDGPEPPILDGDALSYLVLIEQAGLKALGVPRQAIRVLKTVSVEQNGAGASLSPAQGSEYDFEIDFPTPAIGRQTLSFTLTPQSFRTQIAPARTFGFLAELEGLHKMNLARGASLENTLAIGDEGVVNRERLRFADEVVRHKILDAIGDMALAGAPLMARFRGVKSGHGLNNALLRALFSDPKSYEKVMLP